MGTSSTPTPGHHKGMGTGQPRGHQLCSGLVLVGWRHEGLGAARGAGTRGRIQPKEVACKPPRRWVWGSSASSPCLGALQRVSRAISRDYGVHMREDLVLRLRQSQPSPLPLHAIAPPGPLCCACGSPVPPWTQPMEEAGSGWHLPWRMSPDTEGARGQGGTEGGRRQHQEGRDQHYGQHCGGTQAEAGSWGLVWPH